MSELPLTPGLVLAVADALAEGAEVSRADTKAAVKLVLAELSRIAPGRSVEVRVPPFAAVQVAAGATHRRGTPPALVQMSAQTLLELATGRAQWDAATAAGAIRASGERSNLSGLFPLYT